MELIENKHNPTNIDSLIIKNKEEIISKIQKGIEDNELLFIIYSIQDNCKTTLLNIILNEYYSQKFNLNTTNEYKEYVYNYNIFKEINLNSSQNEIKTFCQTNKKFKKTVVFDNYELISDANHQCLKNIIDKYKHNTNFIFSTTNINIHETLLTRLHVLEIEKPTPDIFKKIINNIAFHEKITISNTCLHKIINNKNISISFIINIFHKLKLMNKKSLKTNDVDDYLFIVNYSEYDLFIKHIKDKKIKESTNVLLKQFNNGIALLDIFYYFYIYIKDYNKSDLKNDTKYCIINLICEYINIIHSGNDNQIILLFFTNDLYLKTNNKKNSLL